MNRRPFTETDLDFAVNEFDCVYTRFNNRSSLTKSCILEECSFGNALAFQDLNRPDVPYYNRVAKFTEDELGCLEEITDWYKSNNLHCTLSLSPVAQTKVLLIALHAKGFRYDGLVWIYYKYPYSVQVNLPEDLEVKRVSDSTLNHLFELLLASGVDIIAKLVAEVGHYYVRDDFEFCIAYLNGVPAALMSLFVYKNVGWLSNATTLERFRARGCQSALLRTLENSAARRGCSLILTDTQFGSTSHRNILRSGFEIAYTTTEMTNRLIE